MASEACTVGPGGWVQGRPRKEGRGRARGAEGGCEAGALGFHAPLTGSQLSLKKTPELEGKLGCWFSKPPKRKEINFIEWGK